MKFELPKTSSEEIDEFIATETRKHNSGFVPDDFEALSVYCRDKENNVIGGLTGKTYWNYLDIGFLWVHQEQRESGIASDLLRLAEVEAKRRGCKFSMLDTYEFQALGFYKKQGYVEFGRLEGYCDKYDRYYLKKALE